ncbi:MAG: hypothetical protein DRP74_09405, partial [Candidatus Omnitrophota bacterium]
MSPEAELVLAVAQKMVYSVRSIDTPAAKDGISKRINNQKYRALSLIKERDINWSRFKDSLAYHGLIPFAYVSLKEHLSLLPKGLVEVLTSTYHYCLMFSSRLEEKFLSLASIFEANGITLIPIKGVGLLEDLYPDYPIRPSTDIDVLVQEQDIDRAVGLLEEAGFEKHLEGLKEEYWRKKQYHLVFVRFGRKSYQGEAANEKSNGHSIIVELHWDLDYRRKRRQLLSQMFKRLREFSMRGRRIKLLSVEDTFFALALHQRRFGKTLALRDACDIARLLNKYASSFDWDYVLNEAKKSKVCSTIFFSLYQVQYLLGINVPTYVWRELNLSTWKQRAIRRFIEKNTFLADKNIQAKNLYLRAHFLLYDSFWEPVDY